VAGLTPGPRSSATILSNAPGAIGAKANLKSSAHSRKLASYQLAELQRELKEIQPLLKAAAQPVAAHLDGLRPVHKKIASAKPKQAIDLAPWGQQAAATTQGAPTAKPPVDLIVIPAEMEAKSDDGMEKQAETLQDRASEALEVSAECWESVKDLVNLARTYAVEKRPHGKHALEHLEDSKFRESVAQLLKVKLARFKTARANTLLGNLKNDLESFTKAEQLDRLFKWRLALEPGSVYEQLRSARELLVQKIPDLVSEKIAANWVYRDALKRYGEIADSIRKFGVAENPTIQKLLAILNVSGPVVSALDAIGTLIDEIEAAFDLLASVIQLWKGRFHNALYEFGNAVMDITLVLTTAAGFVLGAVDIVFALVLFVAFFLGRKFLKWLQSLIEDPNHMSLDKKLDQLQKAGKLRRVTVDDVLEQARQEGRLSNVSVIWGSS
jgi:hypothetical protein